MSLLFDVRNLGVQVEKVDQKSKAWVADPANRVCESPGSWLCRGQYPPALDSLIKKRKNFKQLEDFNKESDEQDKKCVSFP